MRARLIVLAGPSGAGKSHLSERLGLPVLRLDDFYREAGDPRLPLITEGPNAGLVDWDHPDSWNHDDAVAAIETLCRAGCAEVPLYDIAASARTGVHVVDLAGSTRFIAEGIFAAEVVPEGRARGLLSGAYCITQHRMVTFVRRLRRDLSERRKPPLVLLRRGWALMLDQPRIVAHAAALGCRVMTSEEAYRELAAP